MTVILTVSNNSRIHRLTGLYAGILVAVYITVEAPVSGMSMNPARSFASAVPAHQWTALWVYFIAPLLGMFLAAEAYLRARGTQSVALAPSRITKIANAASSVVNLRLKNRFTNQEVSE
jgi:aquaporin Z